MKMRSFIPSLLLITLFAGPWAYAQKPQSKPQAFVGVITDTMCGRDHRSMNISPDAKCIRDCVGDGKTYKYALLGAKGMYTLSDQETPARFAGQRVKVTGVLYPKTNILKVEQIEAVK